MVWLLFKMFFWRFPNGSPWLFRYYKLQTLHRSLPQERACRWHVIVTAHMACKVPEEAAACMTWAEIHQEYVTLGSAYPAEISQWICKKYIHSDMPSDHRILCIVVVYTDSQTLRICYCTYIHKFWPCREKIICEVIGIHWKLKQKL